MGDKMSDKTNEPVKELKGLTEQEVELRVEQGLVTVPIRRRINLSKK